MNILLVGSGGREHALAWKIAQSPLCKRLICAPGNPGIAAHAELVPVKTTDVDGLTAVAREMKADLVVVGPEVALEAGLADRLAAAGIPCFGPTAKAARLETSKAFSKSFMERHDIPTAGYGVYDRIKDARDALTVFKPPYVIKADGLAAGKGVAISPDKADAEAEIERMLGGRFGTAGARVVIEEFMDGEEGSLFALCDGERAVLLGGAQDHKRAYDGDLGPNTGGMGAYSPAPVFDEALVVAADLASTGGDGGLTAMDDVEFLRRLYQAGAQPFFDVLGSHPYGFADPPDRRNANQVTDFQRAADQRAVMVAFGDTQKPIWATEFGWLLSPAIEGHPEYVNDPLWSGRQWQIVTPEQQAQYLMAAYQYAYQNWPWMGLLFVFNLDYSTVPWYPPPEPMRFYSLLNADRTPRPAYLALRQMPKPLR